MSILALHIQQQLPLYSTVRVSTVSAALLFGETSLLAGTARRWGTARRRGAELIDATLRSKNLSTLQTSHCITWLLRFSQLNQVISRSQPSIFPLCEPNKKNQTSIHWDLRPPREWKDGESRRYNSMAFMSQYDRAMI
jgi:hypothetical protein